MIRTVVREYKWTPGVIDELYIDGLDHYGLDFWFHDVKDMISEIKKTNPSKNS